MWGLNLWPHEHESNALTTAPLKLTCGNFKPTFAHCFIPKLSLMKHTENPFFLANKHHRASTEEMCKIKSSCKRLINACVWNVCDLLNYKSDLKWFCLRSSIFSHALLHGSTASSPGTQNKHRANSANFKYKMQRKEIFAFDAIEYLVRFQTNPNLIPNPKWL